ADDLHAVDVALEDIADDRGLDLVAIHDPDLGTGAALQRLPPPDRTVPAHDLRVARLALEAAPEHLVARAAVRDQRVAQAELDFLEVLLGRVPDEDGRLAVLVR